MVLAGMWLGGGRPNLPFRQYVQLAMDSQTSRGFLVLVSYFQGREPWIYELGMEAYRHAVSGNVEDSREAFHNLLVLLEEMPPSRTFSQGFASVTDPLISLFERLIDRAQGDSYVDRVYRS